MKSRCFLPSVVVPDRYDPYVFRPPGSGSVSQRFGSGSFDHQAKMGRKTLISTVPYDIFSFGNDVNEPGN